MKKSNKVNRETKQSKAELEATKELIQRRLEIRNIEKERMRREVELRLSAKAKVTAQEWIAYDLLQIHLEQMKAAKREKQAAIEILKDTKRDK